MIGIWPNFIMQVQKLGGTPPKKIWDQKHAKFRSILDHFRLWSRISPERLKISKIGRRLLQTMAIPPAFDEKSPVNFGPLTAWNYMWVWTHWNALFARLYFSPYEVLRPENFTRARDWPSLHSAHPKWDGVPQKNSNRENLKFGLKFSVCTP